MIHGNIQCFVNIVGKGPCKEYLYQPKSRFDEGSAEHNGGSYSRHCYIRVEEGAKFEIVCHLPRIDHGYYTCENFLWGATLKILGEIHAEVQLHTNIACDVKISDIYQAGKSQWQSDELIFLHTDSRTSNGSFICGKSDKPCSFGQLEVVITRTRKGAATYSQRPVYANFLSGQFGALTPSISPTQMTVGLASDPEPLAEDAFDERIIDDQPAAVFFFHYRSESKYIIPQLIISRVKILRTSIAWAGAARDRYDPRGNV